MTSKELVELCEKADTCEKCQYGKACEAYQMQFKCYPFDIPMKYKFPPEANSDVQIQFPHFII